MMVIWIISSDENMIYFYFIAFYGPKFNMSVYVYYIF